LLLRVRAPKTGGLQGFNTLGGPGNAGVARSARPAQRGDFSQRWLAPGALNPRARANREGREAPVLALLADFWADALVIAGVVEQLDKSIQNDRSLGCVKP